MLMFSWIYIVAFVLAALRISGHRSEAFQAVAHIFVGGLFTAAWWQYGETWTEGGREAMHKLYLATGLSLLELGVFLYGLFKTMFHGLG